MTQRKRLTIRMSVVCHYVNTYLHMDGLTLATMPQPTWAAAILVHRPPVQALAKGQLVVAPGAARLGCLLAQPCGRS